jgi:iron complex outermembrane receptor protein
MNKKSKIKMLHAGTLGALLTVTAGYIAAADLSIEEVVVTGTKRDTAQQDLGVAVTTLTANQISNTFAAQLDALTELAPNVTLTKQTGFNAVAGGIRGTGNISILVTDDAAVGVVVDEFALNHVQSQFVELFDVEQVEIFRGPQGTTFGKNTSAGAINITTKKPIMNEFAGSVEATMSEFASNKSKGSKLNLALNVPLIEDTLAARLAIIKDQTDGFYSNSKPAKAIAAFNPNNITVDGGGEDIGGIDVFAGKLKFLWTPSENYEAHLIIEHVKDRSDAPATANDTPVGDGPAGEGYTWGSLGFPGIGDGDPFVTGESDTCDISVCIEDGHRIDVDGIFLNQQWDIGKYTLKSITGFRDSEEILNSTYTGEAWTSLYDASRNTKREMFQQELRLTSNFDGPFNFVAGAAMYEDDLEFVVFASLGLVDPTPGSLFNTIRQIQFTKQERESSALYIDGTYNLTDATSITAGFRRSKDEKYFERLDQGGGASGAISNFVMDINSVYRGPFTNPLPREEFSTDVSNSAEWDANTWRVVLEHDLSDAIMVYGSFAKGFQAGGFAETCAKAFTCQPYNPSESESTALGLKGDFLDGTLRLNAEIFSVDYTDILRSQVTVIVDALGNNFQETRVVNAGESKAQGIEVELSWLPTDNFRVDMNLGTLDHEFDSFAPLFSAVDMLALSGPAGAPAQNLDLSSLDVPFSPELNFGMSATYIHDLSGGGTLSLNYSLHYQDEYETQPYPANTQGVDANGQYIIQPKANTQGESRTIQNIIVSYTTPDEKVSTSFFVKNLTDDTYRVSANAVGQLWNFAIHGPPREIGLRVGYNF